MECIKNQRGILTLPLSAVQSNYQAMNESYGYVTVKGVKYTSDVSMDVEPGTVAEIYVSSAYGYYDLCYVAIDGVTVKSGSGTYLYTVEKPSVLTFSREGNDSGSSPTYRNVCNITTV